MGGVIKANNISKVYQMGSETIRALDNVDITIDKGEYVALWAHQVLENLH